MEIKKALDAARSSIIILVLLSLAKFYIVNFMKGSVLAGFTGLPYDALFFASVLFAGYRSVKVFGLDILSAAAAGALTSLVITLLWLVLMIVGMAVAYQTDIVPIPEILLETFGRGGTLAAILLLGFFVLVLIGIGSFIVNAVVGAIGGLVGQKLK